MMFRGAVLPITQGDVQRVVERFDVLLVDWVRILSCYTVEVTRAIGSLRRKGVLTCRRGRYSTIVLGEVAP